VVVNAVFQGGGVRAIGLVGAVHAAERRGFRFARVAGTSSGSIVAAFLAAGYTAAEMKEIILQTPFASFLRKSWLMRFKFVGPAARLLIKKGLYSGDRLEQWAHDALLKKGVRTFGDLKPNQLRIIASDISRGRLLVLPDDVAQYGIDPKRFLVSRAIRMSTSIPYFFDPVIIRLPAGARSGTSFADQFIHIVDGGLLSNFPLWLFDEKEPTGKEPGKKAQKPIPTIGFQLVGRKANRPHRIVGPLSMFQALFSTMMEAHDERYIESHNRFRTVKIPTVGVHVTQFDIDRETSLKLFESGRQAAEQFFDHWSLEQYVDQYTHFLREGKIPG
jgi:NTE family protein